MNLAQLVDPEWVRQGAKPRVEAPALAEASAIPETEAEPPAEVVSTRRTQRGKMLEHIRRKPGLRSCEIATALRLDLNGVCAQLSAMARDRLVAKHGAYREARYTIAPRGLAWLELKS